MAFRCGACLLFENDAPINDHVFVGHIELGDAAIDFGADKLFKFGRVACSAATGGHKRAHADINIDAALDDAGDGAHHRELLGKGRFERGPVAWLRHLEARQLVVAFFVAAGH